MSTVRLTTTSYVVLGLVDVCQPATPYDLKAAAEHTVQHFWTLAHTQLYGECTRLAAAGLLSEEQEQTGRRRKVYRMTDAGTAALETWRAAPVTEEPELRDPGTLKLFFGADPSVVGPQQLAMHTAKLAEYHRLAELPMAAGMRQALQVGITYETGMVAFWRSVGTAEGAITR